MKENDVIEMSEHKGKTQGNKKCFVVIVCCILFVIIALTAFFLWEKRSGRNDEQVCFTTELVKYAEQGDSVAQCVLGACYFYGYGVVQDYTEAVRWYNKAAEQSYAKAQYDIGECYFYGYGIGQDYDEAKKWYEKAAEQGLEIAIDKLKAIQSSYAGLYFRVFTESAYDVGVHYNDALPHKKVIPKLKVLGFVLSDSKTETRADYTGQDYYETTIETYAKTVNGMITTVLLEDDYTTIHFPSTNDVEEFLKTVRATNMKEDDWGFQDPDNIYWAGTDVHVSGTEVTLRYRWEP